MGNVLKNGHNEEIQGQNENYVCPNYRRPLWMPELIIKSFCLLSPLIHYGQETVCSPKEDENNKSTINRTHQCGLFHVELEYSKYSKSIQDILNKISGFLQKGL